MNMYIHMSIVLEELKKIPQYIYKNLPLDGNTNKKFWFWNVPNNFKLGSIQILLNHMTKNRYVNWKARETLDIIYSLIQNYNGAC